MAQAEKVEFRHYILTRFNLPLSSGYKGQGMDVCSEEYLSYRFDLFEKYCFPSIKAQTCQNFKWLVLFDINTQQEFKNRAAELHKEYLNFIPCYLDVNKYGGLSNDSAPIDVDNDNVMQRITQKFVADLINSLEVSCLPWHLTTRLDSDDAMHCDMIKTIQGLFKKIPKETVYDFVNVYKCVPCERIVYRYTLENGHFLTLAEHSGKDLRSALFCNHLLIDRFLPVRHIYGQTLQAELIHGRNVVNGYTELSITGLLSALFHFRKRSFGYQYLPYSRSKALWMIGSLLKQKILRK